MPADYTEWIAQATQQSIAREADLDRLARADEPLNEDDLRGLLTEGGQRWQTLDIVLSLLDTGNRYVLSLSVPNDHYITNLQPGAIVEIPAIVGADRICGLGMGELPTAIAALMNLQLSIMDLVVEAP
jgi:alpha-galactosidase